MLPSRNSHQRGAAALIAVLVISATALVIGISISLLGTRELLVTFDQTKSQESLYASDTCVEEGLLRLRRDSGYAGGTITLSDGDCALTVTGAGTTRTLTAESTISGQTRTIEVDVTLDITGPLYGPVSVDDWAEIE